MTRIEIVHQIEELEERVEAAIDYGDMTKEHHYMDEIAELEGTLSAMGGEA